jgi:ADP-ribose pyrophosphatase YjhB (NUDIX family)
VGALVIHDGRVLLIQRGKPPLQGRWLIPGGTVELGESLADAVVREVAEETGLLVEPLEMVLVFDRILRDGPAVQYHYVIVDYLCRYVSGELRAGSDALDAAWATEGELPSYDVPEAALRLITDGFRGSLPKKGLQDGVLPARILK